MAFVIFSLKKDQTFFRIRQCVVTGVARSIVGYCVVPTNDLTPAYYSTGCMIPRVFHLDGLMRILVPWTVLSTLHSVRSRGRTRTGLDWRNDLIMERSVVVARRHEEVLVKVKKGLATERLLKELPPFHSLLNLLPPANQMHLGHEMTSVGVPPSGHTPYMRPAWSELNWC